MNQHQKSYWLETMKQHAEADRLLQGSWLDGTDESGIFRGCFFGCAMQTDIKPIKKAAVAMGVPYDVLALAENIFEGLPENEALQWPVQFLEAVPVDADLTKVKHLLTVRRMERLLELHKDLGEKYGLLNAIRLSIEYHKNPTESLRSDVGTAVNIVIEQEVIRSVLEAAESVLFAADSTARSAVSAVWSAECLAREEPSAVGISGAVAWEAKTAAWQQERDSLINALREIGNE